MSRIDVIASFAAYEIRRAIARRKVLIFVAFTVLLDVVPYYLLSRISLNPVPAPDHPYIWVVVVFLAGPLLLNFTAILIAAGAMSEEYEQGTAELLLSKPVHRMDYFIGKFLGGYLLFLAILLLNIFLSVSSAFATFGPQFSLGVLPEYFVAQAFASLLFYSLAFMLGELFRRSSLSYIFSSALFFSSLVISTFLTIMYTITNDAFYRTVQVYLPTAAADSVPQQLVISQLPSTITFVLRFVDSGGAAAASVAFSAGLVAAYAIAGIIIAAAYFSYADVSKRVG